MCGICGFVDTQHAGGNDALHRNAIAMSDRITHRGPDDSGVWTDAHGGVALAHRRLSIIDLSHLGHQPMVSASSRYTLVLNGEIYNYRELRDELRSRGHSFRGHSDTEVLLGAIEEWGVAPAAGRLVGMFAFAVWDARERRLHLVRDRIGEKPLYYGWVGSIFLFGSELKSLRAHPGWSGEIDREALALYVRYNYVPSPFSIFRGIRKLTPGTVLTVDPASPDRTLTPVAYWSAAEAVMQALASPFTGSLEEAAAELEAVLVRAVRHQMVADVPLGAFLSGGVDSSTVVALMQAISPRPVRTFTIGFTEDSYNEAPHAKAVAAHLGTAHTELYVTPAEAMAVIPSLPEMYDEPFADSSQIPTHLVSRMAREHVTVALSGDGGDELFGGYNRYTAGPRVFRRAQQLPRPLRRALAYALAQVPPARWDAGVSLLSAALPKGVAHLRLGERMGKIAHVLRAPDIQTVYTSLVSVWFSPEEVVRGARGIPVHDRHPMPVEGAAARMMYLDLLTYLPDDILVKVDRAAMRVALETRIPFLDHRVIEFAWRIPTGMHLNGQSKRVLREVLYRYVPRDLIERPKMGFGIPLGAWMRGPLRDWAEDLLDERRINEEGYFHPEPIRRLWRQHLSGRVDGHLPLWGILMFEAWLAAQADT